MSGLIGTVAGDDTLMCVAEESFGGKALADHLRDLAGLS
jgi:arginine repressor